MVTVAASEVYSAGHPMHVQHWWPPHLVPEHCVTPPVRLPTSGQPACPRCCCPWTPLRGWPPLRGAGPLELARLPELFPRFARSPGRGLCPLSSVCGRHVQTDAVWRPVLGGGWVLPASGFGRILVSCQCDGARRSLALPRTSVPAQLVLSTQLRGS